VKLYPEEESDRSETLALVREVWSMPEHSKLTLGELLTLACRNAGVSRGRTGECWNATHAAIIQGLQAMRGAE